MMDRAINDRRIDQIIERKELLKSQIAEQLRIEIPDRLDARAHIDVGEWEPFILTSVAAQISLEGIKALLPLTELQIERAKEKMLQQFRAETHEADLVALAKGAIPSASAAQTIRRLKILRAKPTLSRTEAAELTGKSVDSIDRWAIEGSIQRSGKRIVTKSLIDFFEPKIKPQKAAKNRKRP